MTENFHFKHTYTIDKTKRKYQVLVEIDWDKPWKGSSIGAFDRERNRIYKLLFSQDIKYHGGYLSYGSPNSCDHILYNFYCEKNLITFKLLC